MSKAADPAEWTSVWAELVSLARSPTRPAPLLGADEEGVKYESVAHDDGVAWLTRDALRMRITRTQPHANARKRTQK
jgi:hypothetical protein